jgi:hypothetical protein
MSHVRGDQICTVSSRRECSRTHRSGPCVAFCAIHRLTKHGGEPKMPMLSGSLAAGGSYELHCSAQDNRGTVPLGGGQCEEAPRQWLEPS